MTLKTSFRSLAFCPMRFHKCLIEVCLLSMKTASFQRRLVYTYIALWPSLVSHVYVKQLKGHQRMGDVSVVVYTTLNCFVTNSSSCALSYQSKKKGNGQESIQSSTTPDPGYQLESDNFTIRHHEREPRGQPFPSR